MNHLQHDAVAKWERRWLAVSGLMSLVFVILIAYSLATEGTHIAQLSGRTTPEQLTSHAFFANPGVTALGSNKFQLAGVAQTYSFDPAEIRLPVGAEVDFYMTSRDVLHGFQVQDTNINVELIPGEVANFRYTFNKVGEYRVTCNEYCGISHQNMVGKIIILPASQYAQAAQAEALATETAAPGEAVFMGNCAACHQANGEGLATVFPPLKAHTPALYNADRSYPIKLLLYGLNGSLSILGSRYSGQMPAWGQLSDEDLAEVLNYIMTSWGNDTLAEFTPYTPEEIAAERDKNLSQQDIYQLRQGLNLE
jgi:cytochrome c oxidase subunit 2